MPNGKANFIERIFGRKNARLNNRQPGILEYICYVMNWKRKRICVRAPFIIQIFFDKLPKIGEKEKIKDIAIPLLYRYILKKRRL